MTFYISQSKANDWLMCRRKYHFRNVEHLKPKVAARPLKFGGIVHDMVEAVSKGEDEFKVLEEKATVNRKLFEAEREMYGEIVSDITYVMRAYRAYWKNDPFKFVKFKNKRAEHPFEIEITSEITAKGKMDGFVKMKSFNWLLENKTHKSFPGADERWRNLQSAVYLRVGEMIGAPKLQGTVWNYIRSKPPTKPKMLKGGGLSVAQIDTLPEVVMEVINENKLNPRDYAPFIKAQVDNLPSWFQRVYMPINKKVVKSVFSDFVTVAREMADYYDKNPTKPPVRTIGRHCSWCAYEKICRAQMQGNDVEFLLEHEYAVDETEYQTEPVED